MQNSQTNQLYAIDSVLQRIGGMTGDVLSRHPRRRRDVPVLQESGGRAQDPENGRRVELQAVQHIAAVGGVDHVPVHRHPGHDRHVVLDGQVRRVRGREGQLPGAVLCVHERRDGDLRRVAAGIFPRDHVHRILNRNPRGRAHGVDGHHGVILFLPVAVLHAAAGVHSAVGRGAVAGAGGRAHVQVSGGDRLGGFAGSRARVRHHRRHAAHVLHRLRPHRRHLHLHRSPSLGLELDGLRLPPLRQEALPRGLRVPARACQTHP